MRSEISRSRITSYNVCYTKLLRLILATLLLYRMFNQALNDPSWALFYAGSFATSITLYSHMFASQMEAELVILYASYNFV